MSTCNHERFNAKACVNRLSENGVVKKYIVEMTVHCEECKRIFSFQGLQKGVSVVNPRMSPDGTEARLPIEPTNDIFIELT